MGEKRKSENICVLFRVEKERLQKKKKKAREKFNLPKRYFSFDRIFYDLE
jgi:hypothetical protein